MKRSSASCTPVRAGILVETGDFELSTEHFCLVVMRGPQALHVIKTSASPPTPAPSLCSCCSDQCDRHAVSGARSTGHSLLAFTSQPPALPVAPRSASETEPFLPHHSFLCPLTHSYDGVLTMSLPPVFPFQCAHRAATRDSSPGTSLIRPFDGKTKLLTLALGTLDY